MSNLVTSGSITINTNNIVSLYCKSKDEKKCELIVKMINFNNSVKNYMLCCELENAKDLIKKVYEKLKSDFINCEDTFCIRKNYISFWFYTSENRVCIVDIDEYEYFVSNDIKMLNEIKKQFESQETFSIE